MGVSRRFLNLIVGNHRPTMKSLHCIDLKRVRLFYPTPPPPPPPAATRPPPTATAAAMETFGLPEPTPTFRACESDAACRWRAACYPLAQRRVLCTDQCRRNLLYDASTHEVAAVPEFHRPRLNSLSLFVPSGGEDEDDRQEGGSEGQDRRHGGGGGSLFLMEKTLQGVTGELEVLVYGDGRRSSHCKLLPSPPCNCNNFHVPCKIGSYAVVGNGSHVCISAANNGVGTYVLDTARHTWDKVGDWTLPFHGKAEYVPELKLWFGLSAGGGGAAQQHLVAADLSAMDSQAPQLVGGCRKDFRPPGGWVQRKDAQLVNLGAGRFCIARFFRQDWEFAEEDDSPRDIVVLTGLEVVPRALHGDGDGNGSNSKVKLEIVPHKSMCHTSLPAYGNSVDLVF